MHLGLSDARRLIRIDFEEFDIRCVVTKIVYLGFIGKFNLPAVLFTHDIYAHD